MITHACELCSRGIRLDVELEPERCVECDAVLCPICVETGCCRAVPKGPKCSTCVGRGAVATPGVCPECEGKCVTFDERQGVARPCADCEGSGSIDWSECLDCGGYGYPRQTARRLQRRSA